MDGGERRSSQYAAPYQPTYYGRPGLTQTMGPPSLERYSHSLQSPARTDVGRSSLTRSYESTYGGYGYQDQHYATPQLQNSSQVQAVDMPYQSYVHDTARVQQATQPTSHQQYHSYSGTSMLPPVQPTTAYNSMSHMQNSRQSAAIEVMASQFSVPTYLQPSEHSHTGVATNPAAYLTSQSEQGSYPALSMARAQLPTSYGQTAADYALIDAPEPQEVHELDQDREALDEGMKQFDQQLKASFEAIISGQITVASQKIVGLSRWLAGAIVPLGLHYDDEHKHEQRLAFWREFNHCWEALAYKQKILTEDAIRTRQEPPDLLSADAITTLVEDLLSICDSVDQYGLVDYELGIWEEQIVNVFVSCLDLLAAEEGGWRHEMVESGG